MPPLQNRIHCWAVGLLGCWFAKALHRTWRVELIDSTGIVRRIKRGEAQALVAFWHRHILTLLAHYRGERFVVPVSEHQDGEYVANVMERLGFCSVRGSTTRGSLALVRGIVSKAKEGRSVAITPDGPKGPRFTVQPGFILLARRSGLPVYPVGVAAARAWELSSWDRFVVPKPWTRIAICIGEPISRDDVASCKDPLLLCEDLRQRIFDATRQAERALSDLSGGDAVEG